jgi:YD repeat-containing protein
MHPGHVGEDRAGEVRRDGGRRRVAGGADRAGEGGADGRTPTYRVDAAGRLTERVDAVSGTISLERDRLGLVLRKDVDGRVTTYAYDRAGRLLEAIGPDSELRYRYDRRGQVRTELVGGCPLVRRRPGPSRARGERRHEQWRVRRHRRQGKRHRSGPQAHQDAHPPRLPQQGDG